MKFPGKTFLTCAAILGVLLARNSEATVPASVLPRGKALKPVSDVWVRLNSSMAHLRLDPKGAWAAYTDPEGMGLQVVDLKTRDVFRVTRAQVGASFFWAPDGFRLFYRELTLDAKGAPKTDILAYDRALHKSVAVDHLGSSSGLLTFDPRDMRMQLLHEKGILSKKLVFPDERLARWQAAQRTDRGRWLVAQNGVLWLTQGGYGMKRVKDGKSPVESFDISPDGNDVAWGTKDGHVYVSHEGAEPVSIGRGRDPSWHPLKPLMVYSAARVVGNKIISYDLKVSDARGVGRFLTSSQHSSERWPQWFPDGKRIVFTKDGTSDLYLLDFEQ